MTQETKILEPNEGYSYNTVSLYNNTDQRIVVTLEKRAEKHILVVVEGALGRLSTKGR